MTRLPRILALLLGFAALQLTLFAGGAGCPMPSAVATHVMSGGGAGDDHVSSMDMPGMHMAGMADGQSAGHDHHDGDAAPEAAPCDDAAPSTCQSMAPCLTAAIASVAHGDLPAARAPSFVVAAVVAMPPSEAVPPDLPPPRA